MVHQEKAEGGSRKSFSPRHKTPSGDRNVTRQGQDADLQVGLVGRLHGQASSGCGELEISPSGEGADGPRAERGS